MIGVPGLPSDALIMSDEVQARITSKTAASPNYMYINLENSLDACLFALNGGNKTLYLRARVRELAMAYRVSLKAVCRYSHRHHRESKLGPSESFLKNLNTMFGPSRLS